MVSLSTLKDFRPIQKLPFCYVCGRDFVPDDDMDRDHVPARKVFHANHREPPLWLPTHVKCNNDHSEQDKKVAQLVGLRWGKVSSDLKLDVVQFGPGVMAVTNLNIRGVVVRWVTAFHAALYREPLPMNSFSVTIVTPFPTAPKTTRPPAFHPIEPVYGALVQTIKEQRAAGTLDSIRSNRGKMTYECVWTQTDGGEQWLCVFALNLYDWKTLGKTAGQPLRGCAGYYARRDREPPEAAARKRSLSIIVPNFDQLDPFAP